LLEQDQGVARITLNLPKVHNALSLEIRAGLIEMFRKFGEDEAVKVIILTGSGKAFCAGGDLRTMEGETAVSGRRRIKRGHGLIKAMMDWKNRSQELLMGLPPGQG
jgi:enoyl-CoA hydratase/carnithine racemase